MKTFRLLGLLVASAVVAGVIASFAFADHHQDEKKTSEQGMTPEQMAQWQAAATPGEHHQQMKGLVGEWKTTITSWEAPGSEPTVTHGKAAVELIMDGRYVLENFEATMMGMPFKGIGISGYDNVAQKHTTVWLDNMSTQVLYSKGDCADHCKKLTHRATMQSPFGGEMQMKFISNAVSDDKLVFEYYMINEDGSEFKSMEIVYERG